MISKKQQRKKNNHRICVLLLGGLGFMGSHISRALLERGYRVKIFDKRYSSRRLISDIENDVEVMEGDAEKSDDVIKSFQHVDILINLIHTTVPGSSMQNPVYDIRSNVASTANWLTQICHTAIKRIIYVSSGGTVYGIPTSNPIDEHHPTNPICSYGVTKLAIEKYIAMYSDLYGVEYRICRPSNVYGEGQRLNIGQGVIGEFLSKAKRGESIEIWGDGSVQRDYIYIKDLVNAVIELINHKGDNRVFNISSGIGYSLNDIVKIIREDLNIPIGVKYLKARKFDVPVNILDNTCLKNETDWNPSVKLCDGIKRVYDWMGSN